MREHHPNTQTDTERFYNAIAQLSQKGSGFIDRFFEHCGKTESNRVYLQFVEDELWQFHFNYPRQTLEVTTLNESNVDTIYNFEPTEGQLHLTHVQRTQQPPVDEESAVYPDELFHNTDPEKALLYVEDCLPSYRDDSLYIELGTHATPEQTMLVHMRRARDGRSSMSSFEYQVAIGQGDEDEEEIVRKKIWTYRKDQIHHNYIQCPMDPIPPHELTADQRIAACREGVDLLHMLWDELQRVSDDGESDGGDYGESVNADR